jgi:hypothetical protein
MLMFRVFRDRSRIVSILFRSFPGTGRYDPAVRSIVRSVALSFAFTVFSIDLLKSSTWEHGFQHDSLILVDHEGYHMHIAMIWDYEDHLCRSIWILKDVQIPIFKYQLGNVSNFYPTLLSELSLLCRIPGDTH